MLSCIKCKFPIDDTSDGCSKCLKFKRECTVMDPQANSIAGDIDALCRVARAIVQHLSHVYRIKYTPQTVGRSSEFDPELVKALGQAAKIQSDAVKLLRSMQNDAKKLLAQMGSDDRLTLMAKAMAGLSDEDLRRVLERARDPETANKLLMKLNYRAQVEPSPVKDN